MMTFSRKKTLIRVEQSLTHMVIMGSTFLSVQFIVCSINSYKKMAPKFYFQVGFIVLIMISTIDCMLPPGDQFMDILRAIDPNANTCMKNSYSDFVEPIDNDQIINPMALSDHYKMLEEFLMAAAKHKNVSELCRKHCSQTHIYINFQPWALKMADASGRVPSGVLQGNFRWMGSYSECLSVVNEDFGGQYCPVRTNKADSDCTLIPNLFAICIPSTCTPQDIQLTLNAAYPFSSYTMGSCQTGGKRGIDNTAIGVISIYVLFWAVILAATLCECFICWKYGCREVPDSISTGVKILLAFSLYTNTLKLMNTESKSDSLNFLHGLRFFSMSWVILGHTYSFITQAVTFKNVIDAAKVPKDFAFMPILNGTFSVDTYFFLSGFLVCYVAMNEIRKRGGKLDIVRFYLHRIWRLTPAYAMVIAWAAGFWYIMAQGPLWPNYEPLQTDCRRYWWRHLLYINNFFTDGQLCLTVSWFLAADMQMYVLSPIIIYSLYRFRRVGKIVWGAFLVATLAVTLGILIAKDYPGLSYFAYPKDPEALVNMQMYVYIRFYCRMGPYLIGIYVAYILRTNENIENRKPMNIITVGVCWTLAVMIGYGVIYGPYPYLSYEHDLDPAFSVIYGTFARTLWGLCIGWVVYACANGYAGIINRFLGWSFFIPLSRLSYCAYLVQSYTFHLFFATRENEFYFDHFLMIYFFIGSLFLAYAVSYLISMAFEAPMMRLEAIIFPKKQANPIVQLQEVPTLETITPKYHLPRL